MVKQKQQNKPQRSRYLRVRRQEPLHVLRKDGSSAPSVIRQIPLGLEVLPALRNYAQMQQRWRFTGTGVTVHWHPSAGTLVNGSITVFAIADTSAEAIDPDDLFGYADSGLPSRTFQVGKAGSFRIPMSLLKGTVDEGWFHSGTRPADVAERIPCQLWIAKLTQFTTLADAAAVDELDILGDFSISWEAEFDAAAPISHVEYPAAARIDVSGSSAGAIPYNSIPPESVKYTREEREFRTEESPNAGIDHIKTVFFTLGADVVKGAFASESLYQDWVVSQGLVRPTGLDGQPLLLFGVDLLVYDTSSDWYAMEAATEAYVKHTRSADDVVRWIRNKISSIHGLVKEGGKLWSEFSPILKAGVLFFASLLREESIAKSVGELLAAEIRTRAHGAGSQSDAAHIVEAMNVAGALPEYWLVNYHPSSSASGAYDDDPNSVSWQTGAANVHSRMRAHKVLVSKWVGESGGIKFFYSGEGDPPTEPGARSTRSTPLYDRPVMGASGPVLYCDAYMEGTGTYRILKIKDPTTGEDIDWASFPVYLPDGTLVGTTDVDNESLMTIEFSSESYTPYAFSLASGSDADSRDQARQAAEAGTAGYGTYTDKCRVMGYIGPTGNLSLVSAIGFQSTTSVINTTELFPNFPGIAGTTTPDAVFGRAKVMVHSILETRGNAETSVVRALRMPRGFAVASSSSASEEVKSHPETGTGTRGKQVLSKHHRERYHR